MRLLFCMNELDEKNQARVHTHLAACETCRKRIAQDQSIVDSIKTRIPFHVDEKSLENARARLRSRLQAQKNNTLSFQKIGRIESTRNAPVTQRLAGALAIFILGIGVGHFALAPRSGNTSSLTAEVKALKTRAIPANISIQSDPTHQDQIEIQFQSIESHTLRGRLDNHDIQEAVSFALMWAPKDNIRLAALNQIASAPNSQPFENALLFSAENDHNPGVRLKAIQLLNTLPVSDGIKQMLIRTFLNEDQPGIRIEAANGLSRIADASTLPLIKQKAEDDAYAQYLLSRASSRTVDEKPEKSES